MSTAIQCLKLSLPPRQSEKIAFHLGKFHKKKEPYLASRKASSRSGPVITISRQFGCLANDFVEKLQKALHKHNKHQNWEKINKEILETSAKELNLDPKKIKYVFDSEQRTTMNEIMESMLTKYYKSDRVIRKTINYPTNCCTIIF